MTTDRTPTDVLEEAVDLFQEKEDDYGQSWRLSGQVLELILEEQGVETLEIPVDAKHLNSFGLFFRRFDKFCRSFNGTFVKDEMEVDESVAETQMDGAPYAAMHTVLSEEMSGMEGSEE